MQSRVFVLFLLAGGFACAQVVSFGLKTGTPLNAPLKSTSPQFDVKTHRYTLGPTVKLKLLHGVAFESDLLYRRLEYGYVEGASASARAAVVKIDCWELPVLLNYKFGGQNWHPFLDVGGSFNRVVHIEGMNVAELRHRHTRGLVLGGGAERRVGPLRVAPEMRLTHWADRNFGVRDAPLRSNLTQVDFLIAFTF